MDVIDVKKWDSTRLSLGKVTRNRFSNRNEMALLYDGKPFAIQIGKDTDSEWVRSWGGVVHWDKTSSKFVPVLSEKDVDWALKDAGNFEKYTGKIHANLLLRNYQDASTPGGAVFQMARSVEAAIVKTFVYGREDPNTKTRTAVIDVAVNEDTVRQVLFRSPLGKIADPPYEYDPKMNVQVKYKVLRGGSVLTHKDMAKNQFPLSDLSLETEPDIYELGQNRILPKPSVYSLFQNGTEGVWMIYPSTVSFTAKGQISFNWILSKAALKPIERKAFSTPGFLGGDELSAPAVAESERGAKRGIDDISKPE